MHCLAAGLPGQPGQICPVCWGEVLIWTHGCLVSHARHGALPHCRGSQLAVRHVRSGGSKLHYLTLLNGTSAGHEDCRMQLLGRHAEPPEGE